MKIRNIGNILLAGAALFALDACTTVDIGPPPALERGAKWPCCR